MWLEVIRETFADYAKRYWRFWALLYVFTVLAEIMREIFLERTVSLLARSVEPSIFFNLIISEIIRQPAIILILAGGIFFNLWGFASLYFFFSGMYFIRSITEALKRVASYFGLVIAGGIAVLVGILILTVPTLILLNLFSVAPVFQPGGDALNPVVVLPVFLVFGIPGWWLLISFSVAPFILLLEKQRVFDAFRESYRRVSLARVQTVLALVAAFVISAAAYYLLLRIIFSLKLLFIPDLSFRGETSLRIFLYSIPWAVVASFFDLAVYRIYLRLKSLSDSLPSEHKTVRKDFL